MASKTKQTIAKKSQKFLAPCVLLVFFLVGVFGGFCLVFLILSFWFSVVLCCLLLLLFAFCAFVRSETSQKIRKSSRN